MAFTLNDLERIFAQIRRRLRLLEIQGNTGIIKTGVAGDRPIDLDLSPNTTVSYYATDTKILSVWNIDTEEWDEVVLV